MKISVGADHAGFALKEHIRQSLAKAGHEVTDVGTHSTESTDYPDYAAAVGRDVAGGTSERGILVCGSGVGMSIAANKIHGVRAALGVNPEEVALTRQHNDANVLTLGARFLEGAEADNLVRIFLETDFDGGRHERRINKISQLEQK
jgi:ribose 5-phosphate isomerase B